MNTYFKCTDRLCDGKPINKHFTQKLCRQLFLNSYNIHVTLKIRKYFNEDVVNP